MDQKELYAFLLSETEKLADEITDKIGATLEQTHDYGSYVSLAVDSYIESLRLIDPGSKLSGKAVLRTVNRILKECHNREEALAALALCVSALVGDITLARAGIED